MLNDWLFDPARSAGDSAVLEDSANAVFYVAVFRDRFRDEYNTVNVRHILFSTDKSGLDSESETYEADLQARKDEARAKAEDLLAQWKSGEATEDSFSALAQENSEDTGSASTGGLIPDISKDSNLVAPFKDWCFEAGRKVGDTGIVESDYGYHIMYCASFGDPYWQVRVANTLKSNDFEAWHTEKTAGYTAEQQSFGMKFVG